jgi:hypothetical protein
LDSSGRRDGGPLGDLGASFVQRLTADLPSVALQTFYGFGIGQADDFLSRQLPVLLLDSRPPPLHDPMTFAELRDDWQALEEQLTANGCGACRYDISLFAQLHRVFERVCISDRQFLLRHRGESTSGQENLKPWIHCAIEEAERLEDAQQQSQLSDNLDTPSEQERASEAVRLWEAMGKLSGKVQCSWNFRILDKWQQSLREVMDVPGLNQWLRALAIACVDFSWTHFRGASGELLRHHNARKPGGFLVRMRGKSDEFALHCYVPQVAPECVDAAASPAERSSSSTDATDTKKKLSVDEMKAALLARIESWKGNWQRQIGEDFGEGDLRDDNHLKARNVLLHPQLYSGNLSNVKHIEQVLAQVARVNRLPHRNSLQANRIMHQAWDTVDLYMHRARRAKFIAKLSYLVLLLIGAAATICTVVSINRLDIISAALRSVIIVVLSVIGTVTAALTAYVDPGTQWTQLAGAALALESECWKFRTRSGTYALETTKAKSGDGDTEQMLLNVVHAIRRHVSKSASISETDFSSAFEVFGRSGKNLQLYTHGQYPEPCGVGGTFGHAARVKREAEARGETDPILDDHHTPLPPERYLTLRVEPMVQFYQERLPSYYRSRTSVEVILLVGSLSGTVMSFLKLDEWAAIVTAVTAMVTAWAAFNGTTRKVTRYSNTIEAIQTVVTDWKALKVVDRANITKIGQLVTDCEEAFEREREAWASTSMTTKLLQAAAAADDSAASEGGSDAATAAAERKQP